MPISKLAKRGWFLLFAAIAAIYLFGLSSLPLVGPDEPRYAEIAREMFARGDFITPTLGGAPWFEKPPLLYWLIAASYRVFGVNEFAARFGPALCGLVTAAFVWWTAKNVEQSDKGGSGSTTGGFASWSALVFLSCFGVIAFSRAATFDIVLTMALTGALSSFFVWYLRTSFANSGTGKHQHLLLGFYFFLGLSLLAKGLVGSFLAVAVVGGFFIVRRELPPRVLLKSLLWGIPGTLAVAAVWYGPMTYRHGWLFIDQFFVQHHFARFLTNKFHHPQPFYFYIPIFGLLVLPWTVFLGAGLASLRLSSLREDSALGRMRIFAILLIVLIVGLFSMSVSKLPAYVLPAVPAAALLVADRITAYRAKQSGKVTVRVSGILFLIAAVAANWVLWRATEVPRSSVIAGTAACAVSGLFALIFPRKTTAACLLFAGASAVVAIAAILGSGGLAARDSVRDLIRLASNRGYGSAAVVGLHTVERTAEFYSADRLLYGEDGEPVKFESAADVAAAARNSGGQILCFVPVEHASQLTNYPKVQTETIANNGSVSLLLVRVR